MRWLVVLALAVMLGGCAPKLDRYWWPPGGSTTKESMDKLAYDRQKCSDMALDGYSTEGASYIGQGAARGNGVAAALGLFLQSLSAETADSSFDYCMKRLGYTKFSDEERKAVENLVHDWDTTGKTPEQFSYDKSVCFGGGIIGYNSCMMSAGYMPAGK